VDYQASEQIENRIQEHEARAAKLRALHAILSDDPSLIQELKEILIQPDHLLPKQQANQLQRITNFLRANANEWKTARQIADGTGLPRNSVNFNLFTSAHKTLFESQMWGPRRKVWRLQE
jgi:hypothetical protein